MVTGRQCAVHALDGFDLRAGADAKHFIVIDEYSFFSHEGCSLFVGSGPKGNRSSTLHPIRPSSVHRFWGSTKYGPSSIPKASPLLHHSYDSGAWFREGVGGFSQLVLNLERRLLARNSPTGQH